MPLLSPTMVEGKILKWNYKEGDKIEEGNVMCEVETDKSSVGFEVTETFYLGKILVQEGGDAIPVNGEIAVAVFKKDDVAGVKDYVAQPISSEGASN